MNQLRRRAALALAAFLALSTVVKAQTSGPQVTAQLETGLVRLGSSVRCLVTVEGARDAGILEVPEVEGLAFEGASDPSVRSEYGIGTGGRRSFSRTISWVLSFHPTRLGDFTIPPMKLRVDGAEMETREAAFSVVEDLQGKELGTLEVIDPPQRVFEGEPFMIEMLAGWDAALGEGVNYENLILPWWGELPGTLELATDERKTANSQVMWLNWRQKLVVERVGTREIRDRTFLVYRLRRTYVATRPGELSFPTSNFEFGQVISGDIFRAAQKETYFVGCPAFAIEVRPLPEEGRPFDFSGAVGKVNVSASADRRDVDAGDSIKLSVEWTGNANLEFFQLPDLARLEAFQGFRVYGTTDRFYGDRRVAIYDLAPASEDVAEIPGVPLAIFDPELEAYRTIATQPIPVRVRALAGASGLESEAEPGAAPVLDIRDIQTAGEVARAEAPRGPGGLAVAGAMALVPLAWLGLRTAVRRRGDPDSMEARRRRRARRVLARELGGARTAREQAGALNRFLAARTDETEEAWEGRDPLEYAASRDGAGRMNEADARALAALAAELDARRWAGGDEPLETARVMEVAERLAKGGLR